MLFSEFGTFRKMIDDLLQFCALTLWQNIEEQGDDFTKSLSSNRLRILPDEVLNGIGRRRDNTLIGPRAASAEEVRAAFLINELENFARRYKLDGVAFFRRN